MGSSDGRADVAAGGMYDAIVVGAGFSGLYALYQLRRRGYTVRVLERGDGVGGTWFWNRYPGARCDAPSVDYSHSFSADLEQEWDWTERYAAQPEILEYIQHVADRFELRRDVQLETMVEAAHFDEDRGRWKVTTDTGETYDCQHLVMATGCLSNRKDPSSEFPGLSEFEGEWQMTSDWPAGGVDFTGKRAMVIGTGSTGVQVIPQVAGQADHVVVLQRTANFCVPAGNAPLDPVAQKHFKANYAAYRQAAKESLLGIPLESSTTSALAITPEEARAELEGRWQIGGGSIFMTAFADHLADVRANDVVANFVRDKIRATVKDTQTAELLCPYDHPIGTKRLCVGIDYYETYNRDNVELVSVRDNPVVKIAATGVKLADGTEINADVIIFAIGFDAMTGALFGVDIEGRQGIKLKQQWQHGPRTYLGLMTASFPNMYMITGPQSPSVFSNMLVSIEQHVDWVVDLIDDLKAKDAGLVEPLEEAQERWVAHVAEVADMTLVPRANSWYVGANIPGKPRVLYPYLGGVGAYRRECDRVAANGYEGFVLGDRAALSPA